MQIWQTNQCTGLPPSQSKEADHPVQLAGVVGSAVASKDAEVAAVTGGDADQFVDLIDGLSKHRREWESLPDSTNTDLLLALDATTRPAYG